MIYFEAQYDYLIQHNYFPCLEHLQHHPDDALAEALDRTRTRARLYAEAKLPRYPDVPYSPAIANARNHFNILKMLLYQHKHNIDFSDQLREPILCHSEQFKFPQSLEECQIRYDVALKDLKALERSERKTSAQRDKYLAEKAEAYANQGEVSAAQYLKQLKQRESMSRVFQRCANTRGAKRSGGFSTVEVPQDPERLPERMHRMENIRLSPRDQTSFA